MPVGGQLGAPPSSRDISSFVELTIRLRELFVWAGRPKYSTVSSASGIAPSAISNLIGKRPLSRPSETATLRFVAACLAHGGYSQRAAADQIDGWRQTWRRLDAEADAMVVATGEGETPAGASHDLAPWIGPGAAATLVAEPDAVVPPTALEAYVVDPGSGSGRRRLAIAAGSSVVLVAAIGVGVVLGSGLARDDARAATTGTQPESSAGGCVRATIPAVEDVRNGRRWSTVFRCPNDLGAEVLHQPAPGSAVVSTLRDTTSWFVCWTRGKQHAGGNAIWYYTQGDSPGARPETQAWGYVAAQQMGTEVDPDPDAFRECPAS